MNSSNWQQQTPALNCVSLMQLQQSWVLDKSYFQTTINEIETHLAKNQPFYFNIYGAKGSGKSHLLLLLIKLIADRIQPNITLKLVFIQQPNWQINHYLDLLIAINAQLSDNPNALTTQLNQQQLEQQILAQIATQPLIIAIENISATVKKFGPQDSNKFRQFIKQNPQISLLCNNPASDNFLPFNQIELSPLTLNQAHELLQQTNAEPIQSSSQNHTQALLCSQILYAFFRSNGHYYRHFSNLIGQPQLDNLSAQLIFLCQNLITPIEPTINQLPPQQQQIINLVSLRLLHQQGALTVSDIAAQLRLTHQTTSSQLKKMRDNHLVSSFKVGRQSYYQSADIFQGLVIASSQIPPLANPENGITISVNFARQWFLCGAKQLPSEDGQCFVDDKIWLTQHLISPMMPLIVRLKHHIDSYLDALNPQQNNIDHLNPEPLFTSLLEKLQALADNIINSPFAGQQQSSAVAHIELVNGLIMRLLADTIKNPPQGLATAHAKVLSDEIFSFVTQLQLNDVWKHLAAAWVSTSALLATSGQTQALGEYILQLEQQEPKLHNLSYSISNAHCLVYKAYGFALEDNKQATQQTLEQLRVRSDKRNSPQLAGAYCHGIKLTIAYLAERDFKQAKRLVKQMLELSHKYPINDLYFAAVWRLWAANQEENHFTQAIKLIDKVQSLQTFNHQLYQWLATIEQSDKMQQLKDKLEHHQALDALSAAIVKVGCLRLKQQPSGFNQWLKQWQNIITNNDITLKHAISLLHTIDQYQQIQDESILLQLPPLERQLIQELMMS